MTTQSVAVENGEAVPTAGVPALDIESFRAAIIAGVRRGQRIAALFGHGQPGSPRTPLDLYAVMTDEPTASLLLSRTRIEGGAFPSLTPDCTQAHLFEREIAEQFTCIP